MFTAQVYRRAGRACADALTRTASARRQRLRERAFGDWADADPDGPLARLLFDALNNTVTPAGHTVRVYFDAERLVKVCLTTI